MRRDHLLKSSESVEGSRVNVLKELFVGAVVQQRDKIFETRKNITGPLSIGIKPETQELDNIEFKALELPKIEKDGGKSGKKTK